jgi:hypothetical protein
VDARTELLKTDNEEAGAWTPAGAPAARESCCARASSSFSRCSSRETTQIASQSCGRGRGLRVQFDALKMTKIRRVEHLCEDSYRRCPGPSIGAHWPRTAFWLYLIVGRDSTRIASGVRYRPEPVVGLTLMRMGARCGGSPTGLGP